MSVCVVAFAGLLPFLPLAETAFASVVIFTSTGTISSLNFPSAIAASALRCDSAANWSACSRPMPNFFAIFSVPSPMFMYESG